MGSGRRDYRGNRLVSTSLVTPKDTILTGVIPGRGYAFATFYVDYDEVHRVVALPFWLNKGVVARVHETSFNLAYLQRRLRAYEATL